LLSHSVWKAFVVSPLASAYRWYHQAWPRVIQSLGRGLGVAGRTSEPTPPAFVARPGSAGAGAFGVLLLPVALAGLLLFGAVDLVLWGLVALTGGRPSSG
jgi:hypothetical protein